MGEWYAVEIVRHNRPVEENTISTVLDVCPVLQLIREDNTTIRLVWTEKKGDIIYKFQQPKPSHSGFWNSVGPQNGNYFSISDNFVRCLEYMNTFCYITLFPKQGSFRHPINQIPFFPMDDIY